MRYGFKAWAERRAAGLRRELRVPWLAPFPAKKLAAFFGMNIAEPAHIPGVTAALLNSLVREFGDCWSAVTITAEGLTLIICNPTHAATRRESDLMHELAHMICGHAPAQITIGEHFPFRMRSFNASDEDEAAWLGGVLQIPRNALLHLVRRGYRTEALAEHFCASEEMVRFRRNVTGVDKQIRRVTKSSV